MSIAFHVVIPARFKSSRLPGKLMMEIAGRTVIERVYLQAMAANPSSVIIATDDERIADHAQNFGAEVVITSTEHLTGTDRIAEVVQKKGFGADDIIVNVQGDEPFIAPALINQVAQILGGSKVPVSTLCWPIESQEQLVNPNVVKVVRDRNNHALYFSRSPIPAHRDEPESISYAFKHIGLYAYRADFLLSFVKGPACPLENCEALEQLRVLWAGHQIRVDVACALPKQDINTHEDLMLARAMME